MSDTREDEARYRCPDGVLRAAQVLQRELIDAIGRDCTVYAISITEYEIRLQGNGRVYGGTTWTLPGPDGVPKRYEQIAVEGVVVVGVSECPGPRDTVYPYDEGTT